MTASGERNTPNASRARLALILGGLTAFGPLSIDMYLPALPAISTDLHTSEAPTQLTLTTCILGLALGQLVVGPLSDSLGRRRPLFVGLAVYALVSVACAIAPSVQLLAVFRFLQGLGGAAGIVIARAAVRDMYSGIALARFFSLLMLVTGLAPILAPVIGGQLLAVTSWRGVFCALSAVGAVLLGSAALGLPETLPTGQRSPGSLGGTLRSYRRLLGDRPFVGYLTTGGLFFAALFTYVSGASFVLQDVYALSAGQFSMVFAVNSVGIVAFGQLNGWLVSRISPRRLLATGLLTGFTGATVLVVATLTGLGLLGMLPALFVTVASIGLVMPNSTALALANYPNSAGSASALLGVGQFVFAGVAAPLTGLASSATAVPMAVLMAVLSGGALVAFRALTRPDQPEDRDALAAAGATTSADTTGRSVPTSPR